MATQTDIANRTLTLVGTSKRIGAIGENSPTAKTLKALWDTTAAEVLADHPWNEALKRASLAVSADETPDSEYDFAYELPTDCLRWLPWQRDHENWFEGEHEGRFLLSNADAPIHIRYIAKLDDIGRWSPGLVAAMAAKLAFYAAWPVTQREGVEDRMGSLYSETIAMAKRQDGLKTGRRARSMQAQSSWLAARNSSW